MLTKYLTTCIYIVLVSLRGFAQVKSFPIPYDTIISLGSGWFCATEADLTKYNESNFSLENTYFDVLRTDKRFYLTKWVEHRQIDSTGNFNFHVHNFEKVELNNFRYRAIDGNLTRLIASEKIKPFAFESVNDYGKTIQIDGTGSHPCQAYLKISIKNRSFVKEFDIRCLQKLDTIRTADGKGILTILCNNNYKFNQKLLSIEIYQYMDSVIARFEKDNRFALRL